MKEMESVEIKFTAQGTDVTDMTLKGSLGNLLAALSYIINDLSKTSGISEDSMLSIIYDSLKETRATDIRSAVDEIFKF